MDLKDLVETVGYIGIFAMIFLESGVFFGFFLPGDSLLFTAGFLASQGHLSLSILIPGCFLAAILGLQVGYLFGRKVGPKLFSKTDSLFFHKSHLIKAQAFYEKHGAKTIVLGRFIPIVRTFAPIVAGVGSMHYPTFIRYNIIGAALWAIGVTFAGYSLGNLIPDVDKYLLPIILLICFVSAAPPLIHILKDPESRASIKSFFTKLGKK